MEDGSSLSLAVGAGLVVVSSAVTLWSSVIEECLTAYHRAKLFELLPESRHESFEEYLKKEEDYFIVARLTRTLAIFIGFAGFLLLFSGSWESYTFLEALEAAGATLGGISVVMAAIIPGVWSRYKAEWLLRHSLPLFHTITLPLFPFVRIAHLLQAGVARVRGEDAQETAEREFEEDIADSLDEAERDGVIESSERLLIHSVMDFGDLTVEDVMTPRPEMIAIDAESNIDAAVALANEHGHSRLPVYAGSRDKIVGVFYVRDALLRWTERQDKVVRCSEIMRDPAYVPESMPLIAILSEFKVRKLHMAIVVDEHGGTGGIVTMEDVLESIVGDIQDEFDRDESVRLARRFKLVDADTADADARVKVEDINTWMGCELPESDEYASIGGLIFETAGRIPSSGEAFNIGGVQLSVLEANDRSVKRVRVRRIPSNTAIAETQ